MKYMRSALFIHFLIALVYAVPSLTWNNIPTGTVPLNTQYSVQVSSDAGNTDTEYRLTLRRNGAYYDSVQGTQGLDENEQYTVPFTVSGSFSETTDGEISYTADVRTVAGEYASICSVLNAQSPQGALEKWNTINDPVAWFWTRPGEVVTLKGWAVSPTTNIPVSEIRVRLDGVPVSAGFEVNLPKSGMAVNAGWNAWFVVPPPYSSTLLYRWIEVYAVDAAGGETLLGSRTMIVSTNAPVVRHFVPKEITVYAGQKVPIYSRSIYDGGNVMKNAGISIRDPEGYWAHKSTRPWKANDEGGILYDLPSPVGSDSVREGYFRFPYAGEWRVRGGASDTSGAYYRYSSFEGYIVNVAAYTPPTAAFTVSSSSGNTPLSVSFNASASSANCTYDWDFNSDGIWDATGVTASWVYHNDYLSDMVCIAKLRVTDSQGVPSYATREITTIRPVTLIGEKSGSVNEGDCDLYSFSISQTRTLVIDYNGSNIGLARSDGTVVTNYTSVPAGTYNVWVWGTYDDDGDYIGDTWVRVSYDPNPVRQNQTVTFPQPTLATGASTFSLSASASSGLPVTYTIVSGPATLSGDTVTVLGLGSIVISAKQNGNSTYYPSTSMQRTVSVTDSLPQGTVTGFNGTPFTGESLAMAPGASWTLTGEASDPDGTDVTVKIYVNGQYVGDATRTIGSTKWVYAGGCSLPANVTSKDYIVEAKIPVSTRWGAQSDLEIPLLPARSFTVCTNIPKIVLNLQQNLTVAMGYILQINSYARPGDRPLELHRIEVMQPGAVNYTLVNPTIPESGFDISKLTYNVTLGTQGAWIFRSYVSDGRGVVYAPDPAGIQVNVTLESLPPPGKVLLGTVTSNMVGISWSQVIRAGGVVEYVVYRNGSFLATVDSSTHVYFDGSVSPGQMYTYNIKTRGYENKTLNESMLSSGVSVTTMAITDQSPANSVPDHMETDYNPLAGDQSLLGTNAKAVGTMTIFKVTTPVQ